MPLLLPPLTTPFMDKAIDPCKAEAAAAAAAELTAAEEDPVQVRGSVGSGECIVVDESTGLRLMTEEEER